jgi:hypothetical protein
MNSNVAIVYPGDREARRTATPERSKVPSAFGALAAVVIDAKPVVYHDEFCDEVRQELPNMNGALVWVNPIEGGRDRSLLDAMLREVAAAGVFVSAHPDVILQLGTKEVLVTTRSLGWGSDTCVYATLDQLRTELSRRLASGETRVLKQYRGNGGDGVWKPAPSAGDRVLARHAKRGAEEEEIAFSQLLARFARYFANGGKMIDQAWQPRISEGMVRCYLVHGRVEGFGVQAINALHPDTTQPGPRLYHPPTLIEFQQLKGQLEDEWLPAAQQLLSIQSEELPVLWDCDFMRGPRDGSGRDTYVLCEINVSSVSPFPQSVLAPLARATLLKVRK